MKIKIFSSKLGEVFDPSKNYVADKNIVLNRHPVEKTEGATKGYLDSKLEEFYKTANIQGTIDDVSVLQMKGPDIVHSKDGLRLKEIHKGFTDAVLVDVDKYGRITKEHPISEENMDKDLTLDWNDITNKPTTVDGYGIKDLASQNKYETITGKITVKYQDPKTQSPVPYSYLKTIWDNSNYELRIGDMVMKFGKVNGNMWLLADGRTITRDKYPEAVTAIAGASASEAKLPDATERDLYLLNSFGVEARTYIKVK